VGNKMNDDVVRLTRQMVEQERDRLAEIAPSGRPGMPTGLHFTQVSLDDSNEPLAREWNVYCREIGRLLAERHHGRFVLIKGKDIVGIFENWATARQAGLKRFHRQPFFDHAIRDVEPNFHIRGINRPWPG
jgi:hypothetical protein